jgi:hypothetical protein
MPDDQQGQVAMVEPLARHCRDSGHMRTGIGKAKYSAFMPAPNKQVSVFYAVGQSQEGLKAIGRTVVSPHVRGHALLPTAVVHQRGLEVIADPKPHELHANITGWSDDSAKNRLSAHALADASLLVVYVDEPGIKAAASQS